MDCACEHSVLVHITNLPSNVVILRTWETRYLWVLFKSVTHTLLIHVGVGARMKNPHGPKIA